MSTMHATNARVTKANGASAKKESGKTTDSSARVANTPNAETQAAIAELEAGNGIRTYSIEELKADLLGKTNN